MGAHRHGKVAVGAPFLRSRCDGRCLCRAVGMRRSTTVSGWRWPCASSNHISAPPNTLTKAMRVADDLVLVRLHFFGKDRDIRRGPGWISRATQPVCWVCYSSICAVRFKRQVIMQDDWCCNLGWKKAQPHGDAYKCPRGPYITCKCRQKLDHCLPQMRRFSMVT